MKKCRLDCLDKQNLIDKEKQFRLLMIFCPFGFTLILSILLYILLMGFNTIFPMINDLESYVLNKEIQLLKMQLYMEKVKQQMSFSRIQSFTQVLAGFTQNVILQSSFEQVVSWQDLSTENFITKPDSFNKTNFLVSGEYMLDNFCSLREQLCQNDSYCQSQYDYYFNQYEQILGNITYNQSQYVGWNQDNSTSWEDLSKDQKKFIILSSFLRSIVYSITQNRIQEDLQITEVYYARNQDSLALFYGFGLLSMSSINNQQFGGPFSCQKINGEYQRYKYKTIDQFNGFQYYDFNNQYCGNQTQNQHCFCKYNNYKRIYPVDWRCRPWFISSNSSYTASFADPFINLRNNQLMNTCSYKIIDQAQYPNISNESQQEIDAHSIVTVQFDFTRLKLNDNLTDKDGNIYGYQYIIAPKQFNNDGLSGYYQYTAMSHPYLDLTKKTSIIELEYENSINKQEEIANFIQNTPFLLNTNLKKKSCEGIFNVQNDQDIISMKKNGTQYEYIFTEIEICSGNLIEQNSLIVGYLSRAVETNYAKRYTIDNAVISIQKKVASYLNADSSNLLDKQKALDTLKQGIRDYQIFQHQEGIGMCCNNIASILMIEQKYQESLFYMQKAYILQEHIFQKKIPQNNMNFKDIVLKICKTVHEKNFMHIFACRKLQLANIINLICESENLDTFNYFNDHFVLEKVRKNSSVNQFRRSHQKITYFESPLSEKSQKNILVDLEEKYYQQRDVLFGKILYQTTNEQQSDRGRPRRLDETTRKVTERQKVIVDLSQRSAL
ncbi:transmembrane protein, putative (macronuclear) [Tetrahymena thermophila SB210]|uniref:Transmembrane protein, putative n=1 Tax=Tetrahymena thermophila (strain SB210) TaxID=312017 RepID=Q22DT4_TETTS|nr:transmembrane protein, putative [Tetrahymena thermophila SB210]EAR83471.2 transmembrane protein, putative [Tetrahymena thermophila SB210]|eukprot:XP_001031134.2 transmembrane protein, putative [Tetrahymena thermophila SB210]